MTPREFILKTQERAQSIFEATDNLTPEAVYALGMLAGMAHAWNCSFSFGLIDRACNARSWSDVNALEEAAYLYRGAS